MASVRLFLLCAEPQYFYRTGIISSVISYQNSGVPLYADSFGLADSARRQQGDKLIIRLAEFRKTERSSQSRHYPAPKDRAELPESAFSGELEAADGVLSLVLFMDVVRPRETEGRDRNIGGRNRGGDEA